MKTNEIFEHVLQIVCEECELCYGELIIGSMSGHVEGSKAFARYRDIDDEIKLDVLKEIE